MWWCMFSLMRYLTLDFGLYAVHFFSCFLPVFKAWRVWSILLIVCSWAGPTKCNNIQISSFLSTCFPTFQSFKSLPTARAKSWSGTSFPELVWRCATLWGLALGMEIEEDAKSLTEEEKQPDSMQTTWMGNIGHRITSLYQSEIMKIQFWRKCWNVWSHFAPPALQVNRG